MYGSLLGMLLLGDSDRGALPRRLRQNGPRDREHLGDGEKLACSASGGPRQGQEAGLRANQRSGDVMQINVPTRARWRVVHLSEKEIEIVACPTKLVPIHKTKTRSNLARG